MASVYLTRIGYERLNAELRELVEVRRPQVMADLVQAREYGDIRENAEYEVAKRDQGITEGRIHELEALLASVELVSIPANVEVAQLGAHVLVENLETASKFTYLLVSEQEAHLVEEHLSIESPLGKALLGARADDVVTYAAPAGTRRVKILAVRGGDDVPVEAEEHA